MSIFSRFFSHVGSITTTGNYYSSMNDALLRLNQEYTMLHYPYYGAESDSFLDAQANLTDYCMSLLPSVSGKKLLEVGCGNGVQAIYLRQKYSPDHINAIDLNEGNIAIAKKEAESRGIEGVYFVVDDAHSLSTVEDNSVDFVINIESAFHYSDKALFLSQIRRVLKPGGGFVIADILTRKSKGNQVKDSWKRKMSYHHWPIARYMKELPLANFHNVTASDITLEVIKGFSLYKRWIREMKRQHFIEDLILKLFYNIHVRGIIYTLKNSRQYYVFTGSKPV
jgi:ubiquinone/menaquinone biosynthesis C-methylase UbiE